MIESRLADAMQYLDEDLISQAELYVPLQKKWYQRNWAKWGTIAASIVLMIGISLGLFCKMQYEDSLLVSDLVWVETSLKADENDSQQMHSEITAAEKLDSVEDKNIGDRNPGYATYTMAGMKEENERDVMAYIATALIVWCVFVGGNLFCERRKLKNCK